MGDVQFEWVGTRFITPSFNKKTLFINLFIYLYIQDTEKVQFKQGKKSILMREVTSKLFVRKHIQMYILAPCIS